MNLTIETMKLVEVSPEARRIAGEAIAKMADENLGLVLQHAPPTRRSSEAGLSEVYVYLWDAAVRYAQRDDTTQTLAEHLKSRLFFDARRLSIMINKGKSYGEARNYTSPVDDEDSEPYYEPDSEGLWGEIEDVLQRFKSNERAYLLEWIDGVSFSRREAMEAIAARHGVSEYHSRRVLNRFKRLARKHLV